MSLQKALWRGCWKDDVITKQLLLLFVEGFQCGKSRKVTKVREGERMITTHSQVTGHVMVITAGITVLKIYIR